jgi:hypothetical protein
MLFKLMLGIGPVNNERFHTFRSIGKYVSMIYFFIQRNYLNFVLIRQLLTRPLTVQAVH